MTSTARARKDFIHLSLFTDREPKAQKLEGACQGSSASL